MSYPSVQTMMQQVRHSPNSYTPLARALVDHVEKLENTNILLSAKLRAAEARCAPIIPLAGILAIVNSNREITPINAEISSLNQLIAQAEAQRTSDQTRIRHLTNEISKLTLQLETLSAVSRAKLRTALKKSRECINFLNTVSRPNTRAAQLIIRRTSDAISHVLGEEIDPKRSEKPLAS